MKINGVDQTEGGYAADDARVGYRVVEIFCPEFDAACRRFFDKRGMKHGMVGGLYGRGFKKKDKEATK